MWPQDASGPRPGLENYITDLSSASGCARLTVHGGPKVYLLLDCSRPKMPRSTRTFPVNSGLFID